MAFLVVVIWPVSDRLLSLQRICAHCRKISEVPKFSEASYAFRVAPSPLPAGEGQGLADAPLTQFALNKRWVTSCTWSRREALERSLHCI